MQRIITSLSRTLVLCSVALGLALGFSPRAEASSIPLSGPAVDARYPVVASTGDSVHVVWEQDGAIWHRVQRQGVWKAAVQVAAEGEHPALAAAPGGDIVYLAWAQSFGGNFEIFSSRWNGTAWSPSQNVSSNQGGSATPALAVTSTGDVHLFWSDTSPGQPTLYHAVSADGLAWPTSAPLPGMNGFNPSATFANDGSLLLAWQYRASLAEKNRIWTNRFDGAWHTPAALTDGSSHALAPVLTTGPDQTLLAWQEEAQSHLAARQNNVWQMLRSASGQQPTVSMTGSGFMVWGDVDGGSLRFEASDGGSWSTVAPWGSTQHQGRDPYLAAQGGTVYLAWAENTDSHWQVFFDNMTLAHVYMPVMLR